MNNEKYNEIVDEAYRNYMKMTVKEFRENTKELRKWATVEGPYGSEFLTKEKFIDKCIRNPEFAKEMGVTIYTEVENDEVWMGIVYKNNATKIRL